MGNTGTRQLIAELIHARDAHGIEMARTAVANDHGQGLLEALVAAARKGGSSETSAIDQTMKDLEWLMRQDPFVAGCLMAHLLPYSRPFRMHHVSDAIGL